MIRESKTAGCETATPAVECQMERIKSLLKFQLREARSNGQLGKSEILSFSFVPPFSKSKHYSYFIG